MDKLQQAACARLMQAAPQHSIELILDLAKVQIGATCAGLFLVDGLRVEAIARHGISQSAVDRVWTLWGRERSHLNDGRPCIGEGGQWCLWPINDAGDSRGLLYLESSESSLRVPEIRSVMEGLAGFLVGALELKTVAAGDVIDGYLEVASPDEVSRRQLLTLLDRHEWNLSRVARLCGVTRVTIYKRMRRLGITRIRVPKASA